ncbi:MAG TPA: SGNH/GDSL hydrolase family protein [Solirubrobacteraceae bacterium]|nr:SGNH/GDSL hydrolase family protein [Solirubrobacteraceae bacterium]
MRFARYRLGGRGARLGLGLLAAGALALGGWLADIRLSSPAGAHVPQAVAVAAVTTTGTDTTTTGTTTTPTGTPPAPRGPSHWVTSWGAATQGPNPGEPMSESGFKDQTLRQTVFLSTGGSEIRVRFSDVFGRRPLKIAQATVGLQSRGSTIAAGTLRHLSFHGRPSVTIRAGHDRLSDPIRLAVPGLRRLLISVYVPQATGPATQQVDSREISYSARGSRAGQVQGTGYRQQLHNWYFLSAVLTLSPARDLGSVVALGDSITAGVGSALGANANWPDDLARRLSKLTGATLSMIDEGIGGNRVLNDSSCCGISAVSRFAPDVVRQTRVRTVILLEGVNDLGFSQKHDSLSAPHSNVSAAQVISGYKQIIAQAHAHRLRILGSTVTPFKGARFWTPAAEQKREAINNWILTSGAFNGVIDFASVLGEPGDSERLNPGYDSGDHLHPNDSGYRAMANAIQLNLLFPG